MIAASHAAPPRVALWLAATLAFAGLILPDCCLTGGHAHGAAMASLGPICRALR